jgi:hypothetical protein
MNTIKPKFNNPQDYFDQTILHLLSQEEQCTGESGYCVYGDEAGNRCAIGYWIPDGHPSLDSIAEMDLSYLIRTYPELQAATIPDTGDDTNTGYNLARDLQRLHDYGDYRDFSRGEVGFTPLGTSLIQDICNSHNLDLPQFLQPKGQLA